jgi:hypothetical protein
MLTVVSTNKQYRSASTFRTTLEFDGWITFITAGFAFALTFSCHNQIALAFRTSISHQHDTVVKSPGLLDEGLYCMCHLIGKCNNIHESDSGAGL